MALVKCKDCGKEISPSAKTCPNCGAPVPKGTSTATWVIGGFFSLIVASCIFRQAEVPGTTVAKAPADPAKEARFQSVVAGARWSKNSMKNPKSFELVSATMPDSATACYVYRGTNSFNAVVTQRHVISNAVNSGEPDAWNRHCEGRSGEDFSYARHAL